MDMTPDQIEERRQKVIEHRALKGPTSPCYVCPDRRDKDKDVEECIECEKRIEYAIQEEMIHLDEVKEERSSPSGLEMEVDSYGVALLRELEDGRKELGSKVKPKEITTKKKRGRPRKIQPVIEVKEEPTSGLPGGPVGDPDAYHKEEQPVIEDKDDTSPLPESEETKDEGKTPVLKKRYKERTILYLSFPDRYRDIYFELKRIANEEDRKISMQALHFLKRGVEAYNRKNPQ